MPPVRTVFALFVLISGLAAGALAQAPVSYRFSFPEREHRMMQVEAVFTEVPAGPVRLHMSRSSPGRYAVHEFAKNVFDVRITDPSGKPLTVTRPHASQWEVTGHDGSVRVTYRVFGDRIDGTYLAVDTTHAHINMPAVIMWAAGLEDRPISIRFDRPGGVSWRVASQLFPGRDDFSFSAPNLQYLMDSPAEFSAFSLRTFTVQDEVRAPVFRVAVHHQGTEEEVDRLVRDVQAIVREARRVFGEYPAFEGNTYTLLADYLPWAIGDGMEHRNSTVVTSSTSIRTGRDDLLDTISHEFFHVWNVERIRPKSLEPFRFDDSNVAAELWFSEGVTSYYGPLVIKRAGLSETKDFAHEMGRVVDTVTRAPGRRVRSAVEMSQFAPFFDRAAAVDRTNFDNTFLSYYTWGEAIGLGLDLSLRDRSDGRVTLDDFMRVLWGKYGNPGSRRAGYVTTPYTPDDLKVVLAEVSGDASFANEFFARYIEGREVVDYARLLARAGMILRLATPGRAFAGNLQVQESPAGVQIIAPVPFGSPAYEAGLERDDVIESIGGAKVTTVGDLERLISAKMPGDSLSVTFERRGAKVSSSMRLIENPRLEVVLSEEAGQPVTDGQRRFREAWLSSPSRNSF